MKMRESIVRLCAAVFLLTTAGTTEVMAKGKLKWAAKRIMTKSVTKKGGLVAAGVGAIGAVGVALAADKLDSTLTKEALEKINRARRNRGQSCQALAQEYQNLLPHAVHYARRSALVYDHAKLVAEGRVSQVVDPANPNRKNLYRFPEGVASVYLNYDPGEPTAYYAEIWWNDANKNAPIELIFRGTQPDEMDNIFTDIKQAFGKLTPHYEWASILLEAIRNGSPSDKERLVVVSGHSLGGGLATYSVLRHPDRAIAMTFNPAGLPVNSIARARVGANAALTSNNVHNFISHFRGYSQPEYVQGCLKYHREKNQEPPSTCFENQPDHSHKEFLDPLSTLSFAQQWTSQHSRMVMHMAGKKYLVDLGPAATLKDMGKRHSIAALADELHKYSSAPPAPQTLCQYNVGYMQN